MLRLSKDDAGEGAVLAHILTDPLAGGRQLTSCHYWSGDSADWSSQCWWIGGVSSSKVTTCLQEHGGGLLQYSACELKQWLRCKVLPFSFNSFHDRWRNKSPVLYVVAQFYRTNSNTCQPKLKCISRHLVSPLVMLCQACSSNTFTFCMFNCLFAFSLQQVKHIMISWLQPNRSRRFHCSCLHV